MTIEPDDPELQVARQALAAHQKLYECGGGTYEQIVRISTDVRAANNEKRYEIYRLELALKSIVNATWASKATLLEMAQAALDGAVVGAAPRPPQRTNEALSKETK